MRVFANFDALRLHSACGASPPRAPGRTFRLRAAAWAGASEEPPRHPPPPSQMLAMAAVTAPTAVGWSAVELGVWSGLCREVAGGGEERHRRSRRESNHST